MHTCPWSGSYTLELMEMKWYERQFLVYNGVLIPLGRALFNADNRAFRYGDAIFETIRISKAEPLFWDWHYQRLILGMSVLKMSVASLPSKQLLRESVIDLVVKNRIFADARVRLTVFRKGEGFYTPRQMQVSWLIEADNLGSTGYSFPDKGLKIEVSTDFPKQLSPVSPFKTAGSLPYVMAGIFAKENAVDDCLIVNSAGKIIESYNSNLFWVKDEIIYTPIIASGCIDGVFRKAVLEAAASLKVKVVECSGASLEELREADEIFLTNVISGIRWVAAFKDRRYYASISKRLQREIDEFINL